jgi:ubiquinone/menaquinone biosynthesis C-methylase UbiE
MENVYETIEKRWDSGANHYDAVHCAEEDIAPWTAAIGRVLGPDLNKSVLDVGTGTGFVSLIEAEIGYRTMGLDLSTGMMGVAQKHAAERGVPLLFVHSKVESTPFLDDSFDYVTNRCLMWTLLDPVTALAVWRRILKPGGKVVAFVHLSPGKITRNHYEGNLEEQFPLNGADKAAYIKTFEDAGLTEVEAIALKELLFSYSKGSEGNCWHAFVGRKP